MSNKHQKHYLIRKRIFSAALAATLVITISALSPLESAVSVLAAESSPAPAPAVETNANTEQAAISGSSTQTSPNGEAAAGDSTNVANNTNTDSNAAATGTDSNAASVPLITSINPLAIEDTLLSFDDKPSLDEVTGKLPETLSVSLNNSTEFTDISVKWVSTEDYTNTTYEEYEFKPSWDISVYPLSPELDADADTPYIIVQVSQAMSDIYLADLEQAKSELDALAKKKAILALVYLCDAYEIKQAPGIDEDTLINADSGQSVQIIGVDEDSNKNIWYFVSTDIGGQSYNGYIQRDYLAYSDEELISWEQQHIRNTAAMLRSAAPAALSLEAGSAVPLDIKAFPASYRSGLMALKAKHPNWVFVKMKTDVDWNNAVQSENQEKRSLIHSSANAAWKKGAYDNSWSYPTDGIVAYYMDPRNFLTEDHIFQFEFLSYNATYHIESAVQSILNGTFMSGTLPGDSNGRTYAQVFCALAKQMDVSPFHLASRVRQEQGDGRSALISGTYFGCAGIYRGIYNYFNIGATGAGNQQVIENGLKKAKEYGWTTPYLSLEGGSNIISKNYIRTGQNTLYLQKFNVNKNSSSGLYNHQYMQNIAAPSSEAKSVRKGYTSAGSVDNPFVFRIPVFDNMPDSACAQPTAAKELTLSKNAFSLKAGESTVLTASIDGKAVDSSAVSYSSSAPQIASVDASGTVKALTAGTAVISCSASGASSATCTVTVAKATPTVTVPALNAVTYASGQTLKNIALPAGWTWDLPSTVPTVINSGYPATFTPSDTNAYNLVKQTIPLKVNKGTPSYTVPSGLQTIAGNTLAALSLPAGFTWETPTTVLQKSGKYTASYNPDTANYQTVTGISIPVTVTEKNPICTKHSYGQWIVTKKATCTQKGTQEHYCNICHEKETSDIPALGHSYSSAVTTPATETSTGVRTYTCSICKDTYTETITKLPPSHKHSYTPKVTKDATCTSSGVRTYTCSCGDSYTEKIAALGHSYTSKVTKEATEKENGIRTYTCSTCKSFYTETIAKLPSSHKHSYSSKVTKEPDCTEKGVRTYTCSCGDTYTEEIAALGHDLSEGKCRRCSYTKPDSSSQNSSNQNSSNQNSSNQSSSNQSSSNQNSSDQSSSNQSSSNQSSSNQSSSNQSSLNSGNSNGHNETTGKDSASATVNNSTTTNTSDKQNNTSTQAGAKKDEKKENPEKNITIDMTKTSVLYEETLSSIRGEDIDVTLSMGNSISWTVNGSNIVADEANGIDMGISVNAKNIPEEILSQASAASETGTVIELSLAHDGPMDFKPVLTISTASDNAGRIATLYYFNPEPNELEFVDEVEVTDSGDIQFVFQHASDYAVIISDTSLSATKVISAVKDEDSNTADAEEAGQTEEAAGEGSEPLSSVSKEVSPTAIIIIIVILLVIIAIGCTAYFMLRSKEDENDGDDEDVDEDEVDEDDLEYVDSDENDIEDDYHEPDETQETFDDDEFDGFE